MRCVFGFSLFPLFPHKNTQKFNLHTPHHVRTTTYARIVYLLRVRMSAAFFFCGHPKASTTKTLRASAVFSQPGVTSADVCTGTGNGRLCALSATSTNVRKCAVSRACYRFIVSTRYVRYHCRKAGTHARTHERVLSVGSTWTGPLRTHSY